MYHANVNTRDSKGFTPLMIAALHGYLKMVQLLLQNHADPTHANDAQKRALDLAKTSEVREAIEQYL